MTSFVTSAMNFTWNIISTMTILENGDFGCGFLPFNCLSCGNLHLYIFSIYYLNPEPSAVWNLTPAAPVSEKSTLHFGLDGNLMIREADSSLVWSSNSYNASRMELLPTGNLVIFQDDQKRIRLWQSFDHPSEVLLPDQSLRVGQRLTSGSVFGNESYLLQVETHQVVLYDNRFGSPQPYSVWNPSSNRSIDHMKLDETSLSLGLYDSSGGVIISASLETNCNRSDQVRMIFLQGKLTAQCRDKVRCARNLACANKYVFDLPSFWRNTEAGQECALPSCGSYGICSTGGHCSCSSEAFARLEQGTINCLEINDSKMIIEFKNEFLALPGVDHISNQFLPGLSGLSLDDCKQSCLQNSSCKAAFFRSSSGTNYSVCHHHEVLLLINVSEATSVTGFLRAPMNRYPLEGAHHAIGAPARKKSGGFQFLKLLVISGALIGISLIGIFLALWKKRSYQLKKSLEEDQARDMFVPSNLPRRFSHDELLTITLNFTSMLGKGGFATVYRGTLPDGKKTPVAVKCLESARQGQEQFEAEVMTIGSAHHRNLVKLLGFAVERPRYYVVYELVENMSLEKWLFKSDGFLRWESRFSICIDIARGLSYLHEECWPPVLHLDIKPSNILLDENFRAKICDFGLAKLVDGSKSKDADDLKDQSRSVRGTPGYMAPEWLQGQLTEKADVFSFGIVLLEIVSGRKTVSVPSQVSVGSLLSSKAFKVACYEVPTREKDEVLKLIDQRLLEDGSFVRKQVVKVVEVALRCLARNPLQRIAIGSAVKMLEG